MPRIRVEHAAFKVNFLLVERSCWQMHLYEIRSLLAESGSQNLVIPVSLTSAMPPKADVGVIR